MLAGGGARAKRASGGGTRERSERLEGGPVLDMAIKSQHFRYIQAIKIGTRFRLLENMLFRQRVCGPDRHSALIELSGGLCLVGIDFPEDEIRYTIVAMFF